ncbi:MAG: hypothetical protein OXI38_11035 [Bacteroidota bacterium]|nr:hypothetical protein [Bacteroidota bacterium]
MDAIYWVSLVIGGIFVLLSLLGGGDGDMEAELDLDADADFDLEADADISSGGGFVDIFSLRTLFLFAFFFGLSGVAFSLTRVGDLAVLLLALGLGSFVSMAGSYLIKRIGYAHVSSDVTGADLTGTTATVVIPFGSSDTGRISLVAKGQRMQLTARAFEEEEHTFAVGDEVLVVHMDGRVAQVVKSS